MRQDEIWAEMARRKVQFHNNKEWDQISLWGLFNWGTITPLCRRGLLNRDGYTRENRVVWCKPSQEAWEKYIKPLVDQHHLAELTAMSGWRLSREKLARINDPRPNMINPYSTMELPGGGHSK